MGSHISGAEPLLFRGTILAGGTLSNVIDISDAVLAGLIIETSAVNGTLTFQTAPTADGTYQTIKDKEGADEAVTLASGTSAISGVHLNFLMPFRFIRIKSSVAQTNGLSFVLPARP